MRVKSLLLASTGALALLFAAPAQADGFYVALSGGANFSQDESGAFDFFSGKTPDIDAAAIGDGHADFDVESGFLISAALGFGLDRWLHGLSFETEAGYRRNDVGGLWSGETGLIIIGPTVGALDITSGEISANLSTFSIMANLWYEFDVGMRFKPYFGGGIGWARTKLDGIFVEDRRAAVDIAAVDPFEGFNVENSGFAYQLGVGISSQIMPGTRIGLGYRYFNGPNVGIDAGTGPLILASGDGGIKFDDVSHTVALTLGIDIN